MGIKGRESLNVGWGEVNESTVVLTCGLDTCCPLLFSSMQRFACQRCWTAPLSSSRPIVSQNPLTSPHLTPPASGCTAVIHPCIMKSVLVKPLNQVNYCKNVVRKGFIFYNSNNPSIKKTNSFYQTKLNSLSTKTTLLDFDMKYLVFKNRFFPIQTCLEYFSIY